MIEEQHPIPQQVSAYQFKLVGDMTLQQFFQVAGGALLALVIYASSLNPYIKWPLVIFSFLLGVALAFFPLQDRPLATWIFLFFKAIYSPTIYVWKKMTIKPTYFSPEPETIPAPTPKKAEAEVPAETLLKAKETAQQPPELVKLEKGEQEFLTKVSQHFDTTTPQPETVLKPKEKVQDVEIPKVETLKVPALEKPQFAAEPVISEATSSVGSELTPIAGQKTQGIQAAKFSQDAAPPTPPTKPNVVVGQVVDSQGKIVEAAILEIKDFEGRPVRALKSNKLGHFMIVTPLANGKYEIIAEKEDYRFDPISLEVKGQIIPPIAIWAKSND